MTDTLKILMLEDSTTDAEIIQRMLKKEKPDIEFNLALDKDAFLNALDQFGPAVILADNSMPEFSAREALRIVHQRSLHIPFIMVTGTVSEEFAADIIKLGADDYILKDRLTRLPAAIDTALKQQRAEKEKRDALEEIRRSDERFQTLSKATKDAVWDWDLLTDEIWWNENFFNLLGYNPDLPVPGLTEWTKRIHPLDRNKVISRLGRMRENTVLSWGDEFRFQLADGSYGTALDRAYVLKDDMGNPVRVIGALVDITGQKRLMQEMEVLSMIAKETINSVMIFDRYTGHALWVNEGFTRYTGYTQEDMQGKDPWLNLGGAATDKGTLGYISSQVEINMPYSCDIAVCTKKGETKWQFSSGQPIRENDGTVTKYFVISTDMSERRRMEEERMADRIERQKEVTRIILRAQELERNALGRELHDNINQMLASVNLQLGYYCEEPENNIDIIENCRRILQKAMQESRNLSHHMVMPRFSENGLREELELLVENYSYKTMVHWELSELAEEAIPPPIKETLFRIAQVQLSNIDKHAKASKILMHVSNTPSLVTMIIQDNGIGFDMHQKRRGIGITNIFNRVESYNGTADFISQPGKGCTLSVTLPLSNQPG
ncbi:MAG TPA: PAS domain-containing protein [Puia sp.]|nr:PAS domain-containing protein [Puia sp.]